MRSFLFLLALLPAVWAADDALNATNAAPSGAQPPALTNAVPTALPPTNAPAAIAPATNSPPLAAVPVVTPAPAQTNGTTAAAAPATVVPPAETGAANSAPKAPVSQDTAIDAARAALANALTVITNAPADAGTNLVAAGTNGLASGTNQLASFVLRDILDDARKLRPGDLVRYRVQEDKEPVVRLAITDGGEIEIPYLGHIKAEGKTCKELAAEVKKSLEQDYYFKATVNIAIESVLHKSLGRITIYGAVSLQGPQDIPLDEPEWTVSKAVSRAGPTEFANKRKVKLKKANPGGSTAGATGSKKDEYIYVDVDQVYKKGRVEKDPVVEPGDTIIVDTLLIRFQ